MAEAAFDRVKLRHVRYVEYRPDVQLIVQVQGVLGLVNLQLIHVECERYIVHLLAEVPEKVMITRFFHSFIVLLIVDKALFSRNCCNNRAITYV